VFAIYVALGGAVTAFEEYVAWARDQERLLRPPYVHDAAKPFQVFARHIIAGFPFTKDDYDAGESLEMASFQKRGAEDKVFFFGVHPRITTHVAVRFVVCFHGCCLKFPTGPLPPQEVMVGPITVAHFRSSMGMESVCSRPMAAGVMSVVPFKWAQDKTLATAGATEFMSALFADGLHFFEHVSGAVQKVIKRELLNTFRAKPKFPAVRTGTLTCFILTCFFSLCFILFCFAPFSLRYGRVCDTTRGTRNRVVRLTAPPGYGTATLGCGSRPALMGVNVVSHMGVCVPRSAPCVLQAWRLR
jgi:hypothetical protein